MERTHILTRPQLRGWDCFALAPLFMGTDDGSAWVFVVTSTRAAFIRGAWRAPARHGAGLPRHAV
jgi:hypothetical protein